MQSKIFLYKLDGISLEERNDNLKVSPAFDRKAMIETLKTQFNDDDFVVDESSLIYKLIDEQLYIQGLIVAKEAPTSVGFAFGAVK